MDSELGNNNNPINNNEDNPYRNQTEISERIGDGLKKVKPIIPSKYHKTTR